MAAAQAPATARDARAIRVRAATTKDLDVVVELRVALLREHPDHPIYGRVRKDVVARARELFGAQLRSTMECIFIAERGGEAVGVLRCVESMGSPLMEPPRYAYVSSAFVRAEFRRQGILRALLASADAWARERGLDQMRLHNVTGSEAAEGAWQALGFGEVEQVRVRTLPAPGAC